MFPARARAEDSVEEDLAVLEVAGLEQEPAPRLAVDAVGAVVDAAVRPQPSATRMPPRRFRAWRSSIDCLPRVST